MAKHTIQFSDGSIFETTDEEMTKVARVIIPFSIIEDAKGAIVDFAESSEEANSKCIAAYSRGIKCTFYEGSVKAFEDIKEIAKKADLDLMKGDSIIIPNLDLDLNPE